MANLVIDTMNAVSTMFEDDLRRVEGAIAARRNMLISLQLLSIPLYHHVSVKRPKDSALREGQVLHHYIKSVLVRFEDGSQETFSYDEIYVANGEYWRTIDEEKEKKKRHSQAAQRRVETRVRRALKSWNKSLEDVFTMSDEEIVRQFQGIGERGVAWIREQQRNQRETAQ